MNDTENTESLDDIPFANQSEEAPDTLVDETADEETNPVAKLESDVAKWKDLALRSQADLDNYRKRMAREKSDAIKFGNAELVQDLFPVLDNFHLGLEAARAESEDSTIFKGMEMILKQFDDFLAAQGVTEVPSHGHPFDPNLHEALAHLHHDETPEGHILEVHRKGYQLHDRLLRAPNVVVSKGPAEASS
jgi:molecular chaperone GrpE